MSNRLGGKQGTAYTGTNANQPPNWTFNNRPPTIYDTQNVSEGDLWLDSSQVGLLKVWILVSLAGNSMSKGSLAEWVQFGVGNLEFLTGNSGGPVGPDSFDNINVVGDGITIDVVGNAGTHTLTISAIGTGLISSLTGNSGGPVFPTAGNIDVLGTGVISVVGNPGAHSLTVTPSGDIASSFITNPATGTAIPVAGALTFAGGSGVSVSASGHTVTISNSGTPAPQVAFGAYKSVDSNNVTGDGTFYQVICDVELYDLDNNYDNTTGVFTAPTDGTYHFDAYIGTHNISDQSLSGMNIETTGVVFHADGQSPVNDKSADNNLSYQLSVDVNMTAGDTALIKISLGGGAGAKTVGVDGTMPPSPISTYFNGHRLDPAASFITGTETFITDSGTATPNILGQVNVLGSSGITTSGAGNTITIGTGSSVTPCAFLANKTVATPNVTGDGTQYTVVFDHKFFDLGSNYNSGTGTFTAPTFGIYTFALCIELDNVGAASGDVDMIITVNGGPQQYLQINQAIRGDVFTNVWAGTATYIIELNALDTVQASIVYTLAAPAKTVGVGGNNVSNNDPRTTWAGYRVDTTGAFVSGVTGLLAQDGHTVTPTANIIQVSGAGNISTTGTVGPNTLTVHYAPTSSFTADFNTETNITGDGTVALLGATAAATVLTNVGGDFFAGSGVGAGASYTVPVTGLYYFFMYTNFTVGASMTAGVDFSMGLAGASGFNFSIGPTSNSVIGYANNSGDINVGGSCIIQLTAGGVINFTVQSNGTAKNVTVGSGTVGGYRIA